jgi:hypothetical protein
MLALSTITLTDFAAKDTLSSGEPSSLHGIPLAWRHIRFPAQCHAAGFTLPQINTMVATFADELQSAGMNGSAIKLNSRAHLPALRKTGRDVFARRVVLL